MQVLAGVIQLVECQLPKLDVAGSSPVARSETPQAPATGSVAGALRLGVGKGGRGNRGVTVGGRFSGARGVPGGLK